jgi:lysophospholipase L1-like esterase
MTMRVLFLAVLVQVICVHTQAQKKIVVLGSSTSAGYGASVYDSAWVGRLQADFRKNTSPGNPDTIVNNMAWSGYSSYLIMPTGFVPPADRPTSNPDYNVTAALNQAPDIIIINMPSNDIGYGYTKQEFMNNLRTLFSLISNHGVQCYITTTQPRNFEADKRQMQRELVDSINNNFGMYAINFWDDLVSTDGQYLINAQVNVDGIHVNDLGHRYLFLRVKAKNLFALGAPLPLTLTGFSAQLQNNAVLIKWHTEQEEAGTNFLLQRSANGLDFETVFRLGARGNGRAADYTWTDQRPLEGKSFYRLKIEEPGKNSYSGIATVSVKEKPVAIQTFYLNSSNLTLDLSSKNNVAATVSLLNSAGSVVEKQKTNLSKSGTRITMAVSQLPAGDYLIVIAAADGAAVTRKFVIVK